MKWSQNAPGSLVDGRGDGKVLQYYSTAQNGRVGFRCWKGKSRKKFEAYAYLGSIEDPFITVYAMTSHGAKILITRAVKYFFTDTCKHF